MWNCAVACYDCAVACHDCAVACHDCALPSDTFPYSCNCWMNPKLGSATLRLLLMYWIASWGLQLYMAIKNAATTLVLRLIPSTQCTRTRELGSRDRASRIQVVVVGRWAASSANGKSSTFICNRAGWTGRRETGGWCIFSGRVERTWVILYWVRQTGLSANERSEI